jgi:hypothetical protein
MGVLWGVWWGSSRWQFRQPLHESGNDPSLMVKLLPQVRILVA